MTISSHPDIVTLMTCSAGSTPEALCAVVTSHLSMCPVCLEELRSMETIGVALFEELEPIKIDAGTAELGATATDDPAGRIATDVRGNVPSPLVEVIGRTWTRWRGNSWRLEYGTSPFQLLVKKRAICD
jgi:putative transcriptional regulator